MNLKIFIVMIYGFVMPTIFATEMPAPGKQCLTCHSIDKKVVGPAWKDVAFKYKDDKDAIAKLTAHISAGGAFGWKAVMKMPPKGGANLNDNDIKALAVFISELNSAKLEPKATAQVIHGGDVIFHNGNLSSVPSVVNGSRSVKTVTDSNTSNNASQKATESGIRH
jgi:cytochrome c